MLYASLALEDGLLLRKAGYVNISTVYRIDKRDLPPFWTETKHEVARLSRVSTGALMRLINHLHGTQLAYADGVVVLPELEYNVRPSNTTETQRGSSKPATSSVSDDLFKHFLVVKHVSDFVKHVPDFLGRQFPQLLGQQLLGFFQLVGGVVAGWFKGLQGGRSDLVRGRAGLGYRLACIGYVGRARFCTDVIVLAACC